jgi:hypothetical protein
VDKHIDVSSLLFQSSHIANIGSQEIITLLKSGCLQFSFLAVLVNSLYQEACDTLKSKQHFEFVKKPAPPPALLFEGSQNNAIFPRDSPANRATP